MESFTKNASFINVWNVLVDKQIISS